MIKRIICAIWGHTEWYGMGWLGLDGFGDFIHKNQCARCGVVSYNIESKWHFNARHDKHIYWIDVDFRKVDKHTLNSPNYEDQLDLVNNKYPTEVLTDIHETTIEELQKIGYS